MVRVEWTQKNHLTIPIPRRLYILRSMSLWSRIANVFREVDPNREIDEELDSHIAEAIQQGRDPAEARRAFGPTLRHSEASRDARLIVWLDSLRADAVFGWRQINKRKITSAAAILSLALAIGACTSAFRLIDALLLRPLPVAFPERLYAVVFEGPGADGKVNTYDSCSYPMFSQWRSVVKDQAESVAISFTDRIDLTYGIGSGNGEGVPAICFGLDVLHIRTSAGAGPVAHCE